MLGGEVDVGKAIPRYCRIETRARTDERILEMHKFGKDLIKSLTQAAAHSKGGNLRGMRVTKVQVPNAKAIRRAPSRRHPR